MTSEQDFIENLRKRFSAPSRQDVVVGIGDDGAVLDTTNDRRQVVVTDMLLDGVHFDLTQTSARLAGRKAVAVNLSDLAAMACGPAAAFVSIAVPRSLPGKASFLDSLYSGIGEIAQEFDLAIAGGDTNSWDGPFAINVCLTGTPFSEEPVLRSGAKPGDRLLVTGPLGGSLENDRHLLFEPKLAFAKQLVERVSINAMMDISDGLALDLSRMMSSSNCGAVVDAEAVPIREDVDRTLSFEQRLRHALSDGEDFELLLAVNENQLALLHDEINSGDLIEIGRITADQTLMLKKRGGVESPLPASGYQHLS